VIGVDKQMDEEAMKTVLTLLSKEREARAKQDRSVGCQGNHNGPYSFLPPTARVMEANFNPNGCNAGDLTDCI
jgi:hypothetical protein